MKRIKLNGKHATGKHSFALVDDDLFELLNRYRWKAKPNASGSHIYAVRNAIVDGRQVTIRMHRAILGDDVRQRQLFDDGLVVAHISHDTLDNRRNNLRWCTRADVRHDSAPARAVRRERKYLCFPHTCAVVFAKCESCGAGYRKKKPARQRYCSDRCRHREKARLRRDQERMSAHG